VAAVERSEDRFADLPLHWRLASAVGWALIFWTLGHIADPLLKAGGDGLLRLLGSWSSGRLNELIHSPSTLGTIVFGLLRAAIEIPLILAFSIVVLAFGLIAIAVTIADQLFGFAALGFVFGLRPGRHVRPFGSVANVLEWAAAIFGEATVYLFIGGRRSTRLAALAAVVVGIGLAVLAGKGLPAVVDRARLRLARPVATAYLHYTAGPSWVRVASDRELAMELERVDLEPTRLACALRLRNTSHSSLAVLVQRTTVVRSFERTKVLTAEVLPVTSDDGAVPLEGMIRLRPGSAAEATYYFPRPQAPEARWRLLVMFHKNDQALVGRFAFDLSDSPS
jgi:hypothetical protein